ncbi:acyl-CoA reductase [Maribacter sp. 4U21]|uniref:acyl-CoA reductase n=1 Tax=Maribacter sp. 4U21 TaxID=1889779 RepID=UPI000C149075|nr:acyl-CoA reductase [Maribacter sp. 4U21]PIB31011.1 acyl-CoA reductase [Maribacter sp. 4U21]
MTKSNPNVEAFVKLGEFLRLFCDFTSNGQVAETTNSKWINKFNEVANSARHHNGWFTKENVLFAFKQWGIILTRENLETWLASYDLKKNKTKQVALIMAGNIPLVGFHDLLSVLITGNKAIIKLSSNDTLLIPLIAKYLIDIEPSFKDSINFTEGRLTDFDAVIATGSNNTARYFEYYFGKKPNIIRKNRNSVAVLNGNETNAQLEALGEDIFRYYGLGCRSVSKLFVPKDYDFDKFFKAMFRYRDIVNQTKYANNYDYNKAVYLMSEFKILDNGFLLLKEDKSHASPIASVFYETYDSKATVQERLQKDAEAIQCVVASGFTIAEIPFGKTQSPSLSDYADGIDTVEFLLKTS